MAEKSKKTEEKALELGESVAKDQGVYIVDTSYADGV